MTYEVSEEEVKSYGVDRFFIYWTVMFVLITLVKYDGLIAVRLHEFLPTLGYTKSATNTMTLCVIIALWCAYLSTSLRFIVYVAKFMFSYKFDTDYNKTFLGHKDDNYFTVKEPFSAEGFIIEYGAIKKVTYAKYRKGVYVYIHMKKGGKTKVVEAVITPKSFSDLNSFLMTERVSVSERRMFGCRYLVGLFVGVFHKTV